jgi:hypothetical protein
MIAPTALVSRPGSVLRPRSEVKKFKLLVRSGWLKKGVFMERGNRVPAAMRNQGFAVGSREGFL